MPESLTLTGAPLTLEDVADVARRGLPVDLDPGAATAMRRSRAVIETAAAGDAPVYGVNTGFGSLSQHRIAPDEVRTVQLNILRSHAAGVGEPLPDDVVRGMLLILAASLARGRSGVRVEVVEGLLALLNNGITPVVPSRGSVGASGDLAPLSHAALVLVGEGEAIVNGRVLAGAEAIAGAGLFPLVPEAKEGLALINGTHLMTSMATLALVDTDAIVAAALRSAALAMDACRATDAFLDARLHAARNQPGQTRVAGTLRSLLAGSQIIPSHATGDPRVQDPYCLRATPQVLGAALDAIDQTRAVVTRELGAVTDNPLVFVDGDDIISGGNFHGMPLAIALDTLAIALCHVAGIAERRTYWLLAATEDANPVPAHLSPHPGLHSGLMIVQYTAAALCNELQTLATPASVANIPTSAGIEDYNSMGATAAHQAWSAVDLTRHVIACEMLVMAQGLEHQRPLRSGAGVEATHELIRSEVPKLTADRPPAPDLTALAGMIADGRFR